MIIVIILIIVIIVIILIIVMFRFASITINLGPTFLSGALAANLDDHVHEPSCPIVQVGIDQDHVEADHDHVRCPRTLLSHCAGWHRDIDDFYDEHEHEHEHDEDYHDHDHEHAEDDHDEDDGCTEDMPMVKSSIGIFSGFWSSSCWI